MVRVGAEGLAGCRAAGTGPPLPSLTLTPSRGGSSCTQVTKSTAVSCLTLKTHHAHGLPTPALPEPMLLCWAPHTLTASTSLRKPDLSEAGPEAPTSLATLWAQGSLDWMAGPASPSLGRTAPPLLSLDGAGPRDHGSRLHREQGLDPRSALALPSAHGDTPCCCCCC